MIEKSAPLWCCGVGRLLSSGRWKDDLAPGQYIRSCDERETLSGNPINPIALHLGAPANGTVTKYVACQARKTGSALPRKVTASRPFLNPQTWLKLQTPCLILALTPVCERWIYTACLCFGLDQEEQPQIGSSYQTLGRNLMFPMDGQIKQVFQGTIDWTRGQIDLKRLRTIFRVKKRPHRKRKGKAPRLEAVIETPQYDDALAAGLNRVELPVANGYQAHRASPFCHSPTPEGGEYRYTG